MISASASRTVVRTVALYELVKGTLTLAAGFGLLSLLHRDLRALAIALVGRMHLDPTHHYPALFIAIASNTSDSRLWALALTAFAYTLLRFAEAYGLWFNRVWAEWLVVGSGAVYVPLEVYELLERYTPFRLAALILNAAAIFAVALVLRRNRRLLTAGHLPVP